MNKENRDEKLIVFLRSNKPDVPPESDNFEEQLLDSTIRKSRQRRFEGLLRPKRNYVFALAAAAVLVFFSISQWRSNILKPNPTIATSTHSPDSELSDNDVYLFISDSLEVVSAEHSADIFSAIEGI